MGAAASSGAATCDSFDFVIGTVSAGAFGVESVGGGLDPNMDDLDSDVSVTDSSRCGGVSVGGVCDCCKSDRTNAATRANIAMVIERMLLIFTANDSTRARRSLVLNSNRAITSFSNISETNWMSIVSMDSDVIRAKRVVRCT